MAGVPKVLVVDDAPDIVRLTRDFLEHAGFVVVIARDGHDAIADASDAQDARMARFSARVSLGWETTSRGCSNVVPG